MKETEERLENVKDQKQRIRDRYKGVDEDYPKESVTGIRVSMKMPLM